MPLEKQHKYLAGVLLLIIMVILIVNNPFAKPQTQREGTSLGDTAPDLLLENLQGEKISLHSLRGKSVILNFWASWCPPCREEFPAFQQLHEQHDDLMILGINLQEDPEKIEEFIAEFGITFPILLDPDAAAKRQYNVITQPVTYFINTRGVIVDKKLGPLTVEELNEKVERLLQAPGGVTVAQEEIKELEDGTKYIIHPDKLRSGGPPKDGIPSIDNPQFIAADAADWLPEDELGLGILYKGEARFYPFRILVSHEMVNDEMQGDPILITYCPLCFTSIAFDRRIEGAAIEFGVSGKLYNSELVMYDRLSDSYWPQSLGLAVVGPLTGTRLTKIPTDTVLWGDWRAVHPGTLVLSRDTGFVKGYTGRNPYGEHGNFESITLQFPLENTDARLPDNTVVYGIQVGETFKAYPRELIEKESEIEEMIEGKTVIITWQPDLKSVRVTVDGIPHLHETLFWFAWAAFHPETELYT